MVVYPWIQLIQFTKGIKIMMSNVKISIILVIQLKKSSKIHNLFSHKSKKSFKNQIKIKFHRTKFKRTKRLNINMFHGLFLKMLSFLRFFWSIINCFNLRLEKSLKLSWCRHFFNLSESKRVKSNATHISFITRKNITIFFPKSSKKRRVGLALTTS